MNNHIYFENLKNILNNIPNMGNKTLHNLIFYLISDPDNLRKPLIEELSLIEKNVKNCNICNLPVIDKKCHFCENPEINTESLCIIQDIHTLLKIESLNIYNGLFFLLNSIIKPLQNKTPDNINIFNLIKMIKNFPIKEIIIVLETTSDGDLTSLYLQEKIKKIDSNIIITKPVMGLNNNSYPQYNNNENLKSAFLHRIKV